MQSSFCILIREIGACLFMSLFVNILIQNMYSNVPKVFVKFVDVTLQMRCVTNLKCTQHRQYLANAVEISYVVILMLYIRPCKVTYHNVINLVIYQYGMQSWVAAT